MHRNIGLIVMQAIRTLSHQKIKYKTGQTYNGLNKYQILLTEKRGSQIVGTSKFTGAVANWPHETSVELGGRPRPPLVWISFIPSGLYQLCPSSGDDLHSLRAGLIGAGPNISEARSEPFGSARYCRTQISPRSAACMSGLCDSY